MLLQKKIQSFITVGALGLMVHSASAASEGERLFALHVKPLLAEKCLACHGKDDKIKGGLDLTSLDKMLAGGDSGDITLIPGKADESLLYIATTWEDENLEMPPKENDRLSEQQTWYFRDWINAGAPWPSDEVVSRLQAEAAAADKTKMPMSTSGGLDEAWDSRRYKIEDLWAYQPIEKPGVPAAKGEHPIDAFINRKLKQADLAPALQADRATLIRRATFDLVGLPPTPAEVDAFVNDPASNDKAFAKVVERLLASPHYGEQWGRHWLDVVRYADSAGFANDYERPNTWRYRDYVVRAFNNDKPYDQFVKEQLAGDELDPSNPENLIATGFLRMGPWEHTGMSVAKVTRQQFLDDVTDTVGQVFLSHPLSCCKCHDHKFDPIPTRDYYRIQAVFATTQFADRQADWLPGENNDDNDEQKYLKWRIKRYNQMAKQIDDKEEAAARAWYKERGKEYIPRGQALKQGLPEEDIVPARIGLEVKDLGLERISRKNSSRHQWELDRYKPIAFSVYSGKTTAPRGIYGKIDMPKNPMAKGELEKTAILGGGDAFSPTEPVTPGVMSCVAGSNDKEEATEFNRIPTTHDNRRKEFAEWIASEKNTITARSMVNRIWAWHFGQGIAGNPNNFGAMGKKPTHPELLDWLAATFMEQGWSIKSMHRLIMSSEAYARASSHPAPQELADKDTNGNLYAVFQPRRLAAEELRDAMLAVSGELNPELGGIPNRPDMNLEAAVQPRQIMGTYAPAYQPNPLPEQRNRRSLYALRLRGQRDPFFETFNQPGPDASCELRESSTVTPQAFTLFNSHESYDRALAFAHRVVQETKTDEAAIQRAFQLAFGRAPEADELKDCLAHWQAMTKHHQQTPPIPQEFPKEVTRNAVDELSGEPFTFTEPLEIYEDYVPDLQPDEVDARTRALADVCLVLLNANEFAYAY